MNSSDFPNSSNPSGPSTSPNTSTSAGGGTLSAVAQNARDAAAKVKSATAETVHRAAATAETLASEKKDEAAMRVDSYSNAIHESARSLEEQDPNLAWLTHRAADRLQGIANYVRERDFRTLRSDAENLARRHPAVFFGGMCLAGFVLGSALKASQRALTESGDSDERAGLSYDPDQHLQGQESLADAASAPAAMI